MTCRNHMSSANDLPPVGDFPPTGAGGRGTSPLYPASLERARYHEMAGAVNTYTENLKRHSGNTTRTTTGKAMLRTPSSLRPPSQLPSAAAAHYSSRAVSQPHAAPPGVHTPHTASQKLESVRASCLTHENHLWGRVETHTARTEEHMPMAELNDAKLRAKLEEFVAGERRRVRERHAGGSQRAARSNMFRITRPCK